MKQEEKKLFRHSAMGLEEFSMLFSSIQLTALLPHVIALDRESKSFKQFHSGWRYKATWWFGVFNAIQFIWIILFSSTATHAILDNTESKKYVAVLLLRNLSYIFIRLTPICLVFYAGRIKTVLETFGLVDRLLESHPPPKFFSVRLRTIIGFIMAITMVWSYLTSRLDYLNLLNKYPT